MPVLAGCGPDLRAATKCLGVSPEALQMSVARCLRHSTRWRLGKVLIVTEVCGA